MVVPPSLRHVHQLVNEAIEEQRAFLHEWRQSLGAGADHVVPTIAQHPLVQSASQKLQQAYQDLMRLFPQEGPHNKDAFFDYLCALDFL